MQSSPAWRLEQRTFNFACQIVRFCRALSEFPGIRRQIASQLLRSGTSVGANTQEAKAAFSRREFACKYSLVLREARETLYWLRLIEATGLADASNIAPLIAEADELVAVFTVATRRARKPPSTEDPHTPASRPSDF
jgi:four helix bundle protein